MWWANKTRCGDGKRDGICAPCVSGWFERWFEAEAQMLQGLAAQGVWVKPISFKPVSRAKRRAGYTGEPAENRALRG